MLRQKVNALESHRILHDRERKRKEREKEEEEPVSNDVLDGEQTGKV